MAKFKILIIHNKYSKFGGEEAVVEAQINMLRDRGHHVISYFRESKEIEKMRFGKIRGFLGSLYNYKSIQELNNIIVKENPDLIHIHNLYPLISPSILPVLKKKGLPIVMTVHNYRLLCPNGLFLSKTEICEKCTSGIREMNCIINNCEDSFFKSTAYAIRNYWTRKKEFYFNNVDVFLCLSNFQNQKLIENGFPKVKCFVLPNMVNKIFIGDNSPKIGEYVAYAGRISREKGSDLILEVAKELPEVDFKIAGYIDDKVSLTGVPKNVEFLGFLGSKDLSEFYSNSMFTLFTSICYETFGLSIIEAFASKKPVISSGLGAAPEIIDDGVNGLIYQDKVDLIIKIKSLISNKEKIKEMGEQAHLKLVNKYTPEIYYHNLINIYENLLEKAKSA